MPDRPLQTYRGSCHCGAVTFEADLDLTQATYRCNCSICRRTRFWPAVAREGGFRLLSGEDSLTEYQFHTMTARHYFCRICGIYPFHRKRVTPDYLGINVFCLTEFDPAGIPVRKTVGAGMK